MTTSYIFTDRSALDTAVEAWITDEAAAIETYGDINTWDVSGITDFSELFKDKTEFNSDIGAVSYTHLTLQTKRIV